MPLRAEIRSVQSQLKSAIQNHQMIVFKLKDRPVSVDLRVQMNNVQRHIVSLGEKQKKLLQQLRKELEANGETKLEKPSMKPLMKPLPVHNGVPIKPLVSNNKINNSNIKVPFKAEKNKNDSAVSSKVKHEEPGKRSPSSKPPPKKIKTISDSNLKNGHTPTGTPSSSPRRELTPSTTPSSSPPHGQEPSLSAKQKMQKQDSFITTSDDSQDAYMHMTVDPEVRKKLQFMTALGLVTGEVLMEFQNRRTERKRRSTANPQFLYGNNMEQAMKRKKLNYLAGTGGAVPDAETNAVALPPPNSVCLVCSSAKGVLSLCDSCRKAFHWSCVSESPAPPPAAGPLSCPMCQPLQSSSEGTQGLSTKWTTTA